MNLWWQQDGHIEEYHIARKKWTWMVVDYLPMSFWKRPGKRSRLEECQIVWECDASAWGGWQICREGGGRVVRGRSRLGSVWKSIYQHVGDTAPIAGWRFLFLRRRQRSAEATLCHTLVQMSTLLVWTKVNFCKLWCECEPKSIPENSAINNVAGNSIVNKSHILQNLILAHVRELWLLPLKKISQNMCFCSWYTRRIL